MLLGVLAIRRDAPFTLLPRILLQCLENYEKALPTEELLNVLCFWATSARMLYMPASSVNPEKREKKIPELHLNERHLPHKVNMLTVTYCRVDRPQELHDLKDKMSYRE